MYIFLIISLKETDSFIFTFIEMVSQFKTQILSSSNFKEAEYSHYYSGNRSQALLLYRDIVKG